MPTLLVGDQSKMRIVSAMPSKGDDEVVHPGTARGEDVGDPLVGRLPDIGGVRHLGGAGAVDGTEPGGGDPAEAVAVLDRVAAPGGVEGVGVELVAAVERVVAEVAIELVVAAAADQAVVVVAAAENVDAGAADQGVQAQVAVEEVVAGIAFEVVVATPAVLGIVAVAAEEVVASDFRR